MSKSPIGLTWIAVLSTLLISVLRPNAATSTNASVEVQVTVEAPQWFMNIRGERLVRSRVVVSNCTDQSFWTVADSVAFRHSHEWRRGANDEWKDLNIAVCATGYGHREIPKHTSCEFYTVFRKEEVGMQVRSRLTVFRRAKQTGMDYQPTILEDPIELATSGVLVPDDPLGK